MSSSIVVEHLCRVFRVHRKEPGFWASVRSLFRREYLDVLAVQDVSFTVEQGELVGFLGPNGAGKTTVLKVLSGLLHPTSGRVRVLGHDPYRREPALQRRFALVMGQKSQLWWDLPAIESYALYKEIYAIPDPVYRRTLDELVDLLELGPLLSVPVRKLSLGERMKAELAGSLLHRPAVLFLDEPTIGLDVVMQKRVRAFVLEYNRRHGATVLLTSHYMDDVKELCDRVLVINRGRLIYDGRLDEIVRRYADHKLLSAAFEQPVERHLLALLGEVVEYEPNRVVLRVPRADVPARAADLLARYPVTDLAVQETDVGDVIREVFAAELPGADGPALDGTGAAPGASDAVAEAVASRRGAREPGSD